MASGFAGERTVLIGSNNGRLGLLTILFISLLAAPQCRACLNATGRFMAAASGPVVLEIIVFHHVAVLMRGPWRATGSEAIGMGIARRLGCNRRCRPGLFVCPARGMRANWRLVWWAVETRRFQAAGLQPPPAALNHPELKRLAIIACTVSLGGRGHADKPAGCRPGSPAFYEGAVAWLLCRAALTSCPWAWLGLRLGWVLLPDLSRRLKAGGTNTDRHTADQPALREVSLR